MTTQALIDGQAVLLRARVTSSLRHSAIIRVPTLRAGDYPLEVALNEIFVPGSTDAACRALQLLQQRGEDLRDLILQATAEVYELGGHALHRPPAGQR